MPKIKAEDVSIRVRYPSFLDIKRTEDIFKCRYLGMYDLPVVKGNVYANKSFPVFYTKGTAPVAEQYRDGCSYFFMMLSQENKILSFPADMIEKETFYAVKTKKGDYIYSEYRHHFNADGDIYVDGGSQYIKSNSLGESVFFKFRNGKLIVEKNSAKFPKVQAKESYEEGSGI